MTRFLILLAISFAVFCPSITGEFTYWDDTTHISNNPWLIEGQWWKFWSKEYYRLYIPVIYTLWTFIYKLSSSAVIFHVFNYLMHAVNGLLFYRFAQLALPAVANTALMLATVAFLVHPLQTESVAWIAGGRDLLSTFFAFAAAVVIWNAREWKGWLKATAFFLLGLLSKATVAPLPVALLFFPQFRKQLTRVKSAILAVWLALAAVVLYINKAVQQTDTDNLLPDLSLGERLLTVVDSFGFYVQKFLVPWPLSGDYGRIPTIVLERQLYWMPMVLLTVAVALFAFLKWRKSQLPFAGLMFFGVMMAPVSGIVPFMAQSQSSVADRYVYMAWGGLCLLLAYAVERFPNIQKLFIAVLVVWSGISFARARVWVDNVTFFTNMLTYNPESFVGHTTMGVVDFQRGRMDLAEQHFKDGHKALPKSVSPVGNLAQVYLEQGRMNEILSEIQPIFDGPGFLDFNKTNKPSSARTARAIARAYLQFGRYTEAHKKLCQAIVLTPDDLDIQRDLVRFAKEMQTRNIALPPCQPLP